VHEDTPENLDSNHPPVSEFARGNLILVGSMGSGKTAIGQVLAKYLRKGFFDLDAWLVKKNGKTISEVFAQEGEDFFREQEKQGLNYLGNIRQHVVSLGGGTLDAFASPEELRDMGFVVWLSPDLDEIVQRFSVHREEVAKRPHLADLAGLDEDISEQLRTRMQTLQLKREGYYKSANLKFELGTGLSVSSNAKILLTKLEELGLCNSEPLYYASTPWSDSKR
jgi:shikimate kinase